MSGLLDIYIYIYLKVSKPFLDFHHLQEALRAALDAVDSFRKLGDRRMEVELNGS